MIEQFLSSPWIMCLGWTLFHSLWEGIVIVAMFAVLMAILRHRSPGARYAVGIGAMAVMMLGVAITFCLMAPPRQRVALDIGVFSQPIPAHQAHLVVSTQQPPQSAPLLPVRNSRWSMAAFQALLPVLVAVWILGVLILGLWNLGGWIVVQRIKGWDLQPAGSKLSAAASVAAERLGVGRAFGLFQSIHVTTPLVIGWLKPVLLVPTAIVAGLTPQQLEAILAHELAHIRRHDYLVNLLQVAMETIFFYHPAIWLISRRLRLERELCCDDIAAAVCPTRIAYAASLAAMEETLAIHRTPALAMAARGSRPSELLTRIRRLLNITNTMPRQGSRWFAANLSLILLAIIASISLHHHARADTPAPATQPDTLQLPARQFNSKLKLQLFNVGSELMGQTPAEKPISIPANTLWYVRPVSEMDHHVLIQEIIAQRIPGLALLGHKATDEDLAMLKDVHGLGILITDSSTITDTGMAHLDGLVNLQELDLRNARVTDAGLKHLQAMTSLQTLTLNPAEVTDAGLQYLSAMTSLKSLDLAHAHVTDAGLAQLKALTRLQSLDLSHTQVTGPGLKYLEAMASMRSLELGHTNLIDDGLEHLESMTSLQFLYLENTHVTDAGVAHLAGLTNLIKLELRGTQVTDAGLKSLKGMKALISLYLPDTQVTDAGLVNLKGLKNLQGLSLAGTQVTDAGLEYLKGMRDLDALYLGATQVTDAGLAHLEGLTAMGILDLENTKVTDAGLAHLQGMMNLQALYLMGTPVTDAGLKYFQKMKILKSLNLDHTRVTDAGLNDLKGLTALETINLDATQITDAGLKNFQGLTSLRTLWLKDTQVTDAGVAALKQVLPQCSIIH